MKYKIFFIAAAVLVSTPAHSTEPTTTDINLAITAVKTFRIDKRLVRTIQYNRVDIPYFELELIQAPKRTLIKKIAVNSISADFEHRRITMDFSKSAAVDIDNIRADKNSILFEVGYTAAEHTAPYIYSTCHIEVAHDTFSTPRCRILKWGNEKISSPSQ